VVSGGPVGERRRKEGRGERRRDFSEVVKKGKERNLDVRAISNLRKFFFFFFFFEKENSFFIIITLVKIQFT
jgi:hypothetical protein